MLRKKRRKPLLTFNKTNKLLHSFNHKSTYFYKRQWFSTYSIPLASTLGLLLVLGLCISPLMPSSGEAYADTTSLADASIKLTVGNTNLAKQDAKAGEVNYITTTVNVNATNVDGYKVYVQAAPGNSAILRNGNTEITGVGSNVATTDFDSNKWGYALDSTGANVESLSYTSVPENSATLNPAYTTNAVSEDKNFNLAFAAKFGSDATAGHYSTNVLLSTVADAKDIVGFNELKLGFDNLTYMQDMTMEKCQTASVNDTKQLIDNRDGKKYWITKLQDGNCWMSQNLDLDLSTQRTLTPNDSDVTTNWTPANDTQKDTPNFTGDINAVQSFDPGKYVYATPAEQHPCGNISTLEQCANYGWVNVDDLTMDTDPNFTSKSEGWAVSGTHYDAHYLVGNYYSWNAATVDNGNKNPYHASSSICPKGWQLPMNSGQGTKGNIGSNSYHSVLREYGVNSTLISTTTVPQFDIRLNPLFLFYGGYMNTGNTPLQGAGHYGRYWTSSFTGSGVPIHLSISTNVSFPTNSTRAAGYSIRCVASKRLTDLTYMQEMTPIICSNTANGDTKKLIDKRDSKTYQVTKLTDSYCWMTDNLNLVNKTIDSTDSDISSGSFTVPASNISGFTNTDTDSRKVYSDITYGGYYNWYTATAGSGTSATTGTSKMPDSICPKGWQLPTGGSSAGSGQFYGTLHSVGADSIISTPYNFKIGGFITNGARTNINEGYYWASTPYNTATNILNISASTVNTLSNTTRYYGLSVRCVVDY